MALSLQRQQAALEEFGSKAFGDDRESSLAHRALECIASALRVELVRLMELQPDRGGFVLTAGYGWPAERSTELTEPSGMPGLVAYAASRDESIAYDDLAAEHRFAVLPTLRQSGVRGGLAARVRGLGGRVVVCCAETTRPRRFDLTEMRFLQAMLDLLAGAYAREQAHRERLRADHERQARMAAEAIQQSLVASAQQLAFLASAGTVLASSLTLEGVLGEFTRLLVPYLADGAAIDILQGDGTLQRVATAHLDPSVQAEAHEWRRHHPISVDDDHPVAHALRAGETVRCAHASVLGPDLPHDQRRGSAMLVPVGMGGVARGLLSLVMTTSKREFGPSEQLLAEELARRAALTIDNARLYAEAQEAIRARARFVSVASHELRAPVASLRGRVDLMLIMLEDGTLDGAMLKSSLDRTSAAIGRLQTLTGDLLSAARIQEGQLTLRLISTDATSLVRRVAIDAQVFMSPAHRLELRVPSGPLRLRLDRGRMEQVLTNLLMNAIKYSPRGGVVRVTLSPAVDGGLVEVSDEGIGLPQGTSEQIFEPFLRAENAVAQGLPGVGLGLAICQGIVAAHGGKIWAESEGTDRGTRVSVWLPRRRP